jgi:hypothetical protein
MAAGDDELLARFDLGEEFGKASLGLGDFDGGGHGTIPERGVWRKLQALDAMVKE